MFTYILYIIFIHIFYYILYILRITVPLIGYSFQIYGYLFSYVLINEFEGNIVLQGMNKFYVYN